MSTWPKPNYALLGSWNDPTEERPATQGNLVDPAKMPPAAQQDCAVHLYVGELHQEAYNAHLILDMLGVPGLASEIGGGADLDSRVSVLAQQYAILTDRLDRIAGWHELETGEHGTVGLYCDECGKTWPCDTRKMADGSWTEADELDFTTSGGAS